MTLSVFIGSLTLYRLHEKLCVVYVSWFMYFGISCKVSLKLLLLLWQRSNYVSNSGGFTKERHCWIALWNENQNVVCGVRYCSDHLQIWLEIRSLKAVISLFWVCSHFYFKLVTWDQIPRYVMLMSGLNGDHVCFYFEDFSSWRLTASSFEMSLNVRQIQLTCYLCRNLTFIFG